MKRSTKALKRRLRGLKMLRNACLWLGWRLSCVDEELDVYVLGTKEGVEAARELLVGEEPTLTPSADTQRHNDRQDKRKSQPHKQEP